MYNYLNKLNIKNDRRKLYIFQVERYWFKSL